MFSTEFLQGFPFELFGVDPEDLFGIATDSPERAAALIRALQDVGRTYDVQVEQFLLAALRSYQQLNHNYFPEVEDAAVRCRDRYGWPAGQTLAPETIAAVLEREHGYRLDFTTLQEHPELRGLRSVFLDGRLPGASAAGGLAGFAAAGGAPGGAAAPALLVNGNLMPSQRAFVLGRELGYRFLGLTGGRALTSSWIKVESFDQVLNNFYASYFAGALLIERDRLLADLRAFFARERWDGDALVACIGGYAATPELFFHRLTELIPRLLGLDELFFLRFAHDAGSDRYRLTKFLNISRVPVPHGVGLDETYCRRWPALRLMRQLDEHRRTLDAAPVVTAQRSHFLDSGAEFFVITMARPLALASDATSSVSIGFLLDDAFKRTVRFWDDLDIPRTLVNLTCERCPLSEAECQERGAPPTVHRRLEAQELKERALANLRERAAADSRRQPAPVRLREERPDGSFAARPQES